IFNGILIAISRMEISPVAAIWTRYVSYSVFLPVSLIFLVPIVVEDVSRQMRLEIGPIMMRTACGLLAATMIFQIFKLGDGVRFAEIHVAFAQRKASLLFIDLMRFDSTPGKAGRGCGAVRYRADGAWALERSDELAAALFRVATDVPQRPFARGNTGPSGMVCGYEHGKSGGTAGVWPIDNQSTVLGRTVIWSKVALLVSMATLRYFPAHFCR